MGHSLLLRWRGGEEPRPRESFPVSVRGEVHPLVPVAGEQGDHCLSRVSVSQSLRAEEVADGGSREGHSGTHVLQ